MGWLATRKGKDGVVRHTAVYRDLHGRKRSAGTFKTERTANKAWQKAEQDLAMGRVGDLRRGRQTLRRYVEIEWFPNHVIEETTREGYTCLLNRYILPELGEMRMFEILPFHIREWVTRMQTAHGANPPTIAKAKVVIDAIFTTALNDQITYLHAGKGVKTPPVVTKIRRIVSPEQFDALYRLLEDEAIRLLVETDIETGLRWGELTELRPSDIDFNTGILTVSRVVVHLKEKGRPNDKRFIVKQYPKDKEWRQMKLAEHLLRKLRASITDRNLSDNDLLFSMSEPEGPAVRRRPEVLPNPATLGLTEPNEKRRQYQHGTMTAYQAGRCRCQHCRDAVAAYRALRRAQGKDSPRTPRAVRTDGHIPNDWFRNNPWRKATAAADIGFHITPHGLRHAHASWLLAGGADIQVVKSRLGHGSIRTTERYLHTLPGSDDSALTALAAIRGASTPATPMPIESEGKRRKNKGGKAKKSQKATKADLKQLIAMVSELAGGDEASGTAAARGRRTA
jgi:integrase